MLLVAILLLAGFFRLYRITSLPPGLFWDEAASGNSAWAALHDHSPEGGFKIFYPGAAGNTGMFVNLEAVALSVFVPPSGLPSPWMLRIVSAIAGMLTVLGIFYLTRELFYRESHNEPTANAIALLATFFVATSFWHINFSRIAFSSILEPLFLVWSFFLLLRAWRLAEEASSWTSRALFTAILAGIVYGLGFYTYIGYRATPLLVVAFFVWEYWQTENRKKLWQLFVLFLLATFVAALPLIVFFVQHPGELIDRVGDVSIFGDAHPWGDFWLYLIATIGMFNIWGDMNWRHNIAGAPELFLPVGISFLYGLWVGVKKVFVRHFRFSDRTKGRQSSRAAFVLFMWLIVGLLPEVLSNEGIPHSLRSILVIPAAYMLAAWGAVALYQMLRERWSANPMLIHVLRGGAVVLLLACAVNAYVSYFVIWANAPDVPPSFIQGAVDFAAAVNAMPQNTPKFLVVQPDNTYIVRGTPVSAATVQFLTNSFLESERERKHIMYVYPGANIPVPRGSFVGIIPER